MYNDRLPKISRQYSKHKGGSYMQILFLIVLPVRMEMQSIINLYWNGYEKDSLYFCIIVIVNCNLQSRGIMKITGLS